MEVVREVRRFDVFLVALDPTQGSEIAKPRPCLVISPDEMNRAIRTVIVAPMMTRARGYASRVPLIFRRKKGEVALDQMRAVDKTRIVRRLGAVPQATAAAVAGVLVEMFVYEGAA